MSFFVTNHILTHQWFVFESVTHPIPYSFANSKDRSVAKQAFKGST